MSIEDGCVANAAMRARISRRRFIAITAAAAGLSLAPLDRPTRAQAEAVAWQGQAMGAAASLLIYHPDRASAQRLAERAIAEARRLERIFSLYRADSALVALNRDGVLVAPPGDLVALLGECRRYWELTGGVFDPTVQALWALYRDHFATAGHDPAGPPARAVAAALDKVGFNRVAFDRNRVVLGRRFMGLTLNGLAQGFVTDRVVDILRSGGIERCLVDMGESRAIGERPFGGPWRIGIADPDAPDEIRERLDILDKAVATSSPSGFRFEPSGRFNHLLDPRRGGSAALYKSLTVIAPTATAADALSTAFSLLPPDAIRSVLRTLGEGQVRFTAATGERAILDFVA